MKKIELVFDRLSVDWTPEEDEAFNELESRTFWPFPNQILPNKPGEPKFNPDNHEDAPW
jgi:hypothetical protein